MSRKKSETLRLLEVMTESDLRRFADYCGLERGRSGAELRRGLVGRLGTSLEGLVSQRGPWNRDDWNLLVVRMGGNAQGAFEDLRRELRRLLGSDAVATTDPPSLAEPPPSPRPPPHLPSVGALIKDRYRLLERLGAGGFGTVFSARDELVADDQLVLKFANHPDGAESVLNEYRKTANLNHPNICSYKHYDKCDEYGPFVVMRHGGIAVAKLAESKGVDLGLALAILHGAAAALDFAHDQGVIHGDVNPGNILVARDQRVQLTDFGIAACMERVFGTHGQKTMVGTSIRGFHQLFGAPEIKFGVLKPNSDQYSLALVFCAALKGMAQFQGPEQAIEQLSAAQQQAIGRALHAVHAARFPSCTDFARAMMDDGRTGLGD
jgi:hypothetical protein